MEYKCSVCDYTSPFKITIERHMIKKKKCGDNPTIIEVPVHIKCEFCNKLYKTRDNLTKHLKFCKIKNNEILLPIEPEIIETLNNDSILKEIIENLKKENESLKIKLSEKQKPNYKSKLNSVLRFAVWNSVIGNKIAVHKCLCCNSNEISQQNFQCGHVVSRNNGGEDIIDNLVPICGSCNSSMGSTDMDSFIKTLTVSN